MQIGNTVQLTFCSGLDMLDFVQVVCDHLSELAGLDEDAVHWVGVAVRESVVNAITHGNGGDARKHVHVEFTRLLAGPETGLAVRVRDEGDGFSPEHLPDPLAPENLLRPCGRGIFLMRRFMDEIEWHRAPEGGMEVRMLKRVSPRAPA